MSSRVLERSNKNVHPARSFCRRIGPSKAILFSRTATALLKYRGSKLVYNWRICAGGVGQRLLPPIAAPSIKRKAARDFARRLVQGLPTTIIAGLVVTFDIAVRATA